MKFNILSCVVLLLCSNHFSYGQNSSEVSKMNSNIQPISSKIIINNNSNTNYPKSLPTSINQVSSEGNISSQEPVSQAANNLETTTTNKQNQDSIQIQNQTQNQTQNQNQNQNPISSVKTSGNDYNALPEKIKNKLKGYENFKKQYEKSQNNGKEIGSNLECIQTLLSNIFYPFNYNSLEDYYKIVCDPNTQIEPLLQLKKKIEEGKEICKTSGINYEIAYKLMKIHYYQNCIKDQENNYCYNNYKSYYRDSNNVAADSENLWNNIKYTICVDKKDQDIDFCTKMILFSNNLSNSLITEDFQIELYYDFNRTYTVKVKKIEQDYIFKECQANKHIKDIINNKENFSDENVKKLIELANSGSDTLNILSYNKFIIIMIIAIYLL